MYKNQTYTLPDILATLRSISHPSGQIIEGNLFHLFDRNQGLKFENENTRFHYWFVSSLLCLYYPGSWQTGVHILTLLIQDAVYRERLVGICPEFGLNTDMVMVAHLLEAVFFPHLLESEPTSDLDCIEKIENIIQHYQLSF